MEQFLNISFIILSVIFGFTFFGFAITSHKEKEERARKIALLLAVGGSGVFLALPSLDTPLKIMIASFVLALALGMLVYVLLPIGKIKIGNQFPTFQFDERDIMFARARLIPGSENYNTYYQLRPENKLADDNTREKPGLLSPQSKLANPPLFTSPHASFSLTEAMHSIVEGEAATQQMELPRDKMTTYIKGLSRYYGALDVGITELKDYHVYSHIGRGPGIYGAPITLDHQTAIAFTVEMDHEMVGVNPQPPGIMESAKQYVESARIAVQLAEVIRAMGYEARAHMDGNYRVIAPLVARDAGLGEIGRMGLLMTPRQGPRVRLGVVTTTLPLNLDSYTPNEAMIDFCNICMKCAENCPSKSISFEEREEIKNTIRWRINPDSCFAYWNVIGTDCGICMTVCPFSHPDSFFHNLTRWGIQHSGGFRRAVLWMDDLFYGRKPAPRPAPEWTQIP